MKTPKHMTRKRFEKYIYECALRDRHTYLESITPDYFEPDEECAKEMAECRDEIIAIKNRLIGC